MHYNTQFMPTFRPRSAGFVSPFQQGEARAFACRADWTTNWINRLCTPAHALNRMKLSAAVYLLFFSFPPERELSRFISPVVWGLFPFVVCRIHIYTDSKHFSNAREENPFLFSKLFSKRLLF